MQVFARRTLSLAALLLLAGCGGGGGSSTPTPVTPAPTPTPAPTLSVSQNSAPLTATLTENTAAVAVNGSVTYTLTVTNTSASATTLVTALDNGHAAPLASLSIKNATGQTVYPVTTPLGRTPQIDPPPPPGQDGTILAPGQSVSLSRTVSAFAAAGTYSATAAFMLSPSSLDAPRTVTLPVLTVTAR